MDNAMQPFVFAVLVGTGATALTDVWAALRKRFFKATSLDYALVGRWLVHVAHGRFRHDPIAASPRVRGERAIGWTAHYLIGIAFASVLPAVWGIEWFRHPTLGPALIVGIGSVVAPFFIMQPGMGFGIAGSRTPNPAAARLRTLVTHAVFGLGLYAAAWLIQVVSHVL